jgi:V/A-type H+-transporting ATPase subunit I
MSIESLVKVTVYGRIADKQSALAALQEAGCMHIVPLKPPAQPPPPPPGAEIRSALTFLRSCPQRWHQDHDASHFDAASVVEAALVIRDRLRVLADERDRLQRRIEDLRPWGDFDFPPAGVSDAGVRLWFYVVPHYLMDKVRRSEYRWYIVRRDNRHCYVVVVAAEEPEAMPVARTHTGSIPLGRLQARLESIDIELDELQARRSALSRWCELLERNIHDLESDAALGVAEKQTFDTERLFVLRGWVPEVAMPVLRQALRGKAALTVEVPANGDEPPTLISPAPLFAAGKDVVAFYMTPGYRTWDPSTIVLLSASLFFAIILADAAYGLLLSGIALIAVRRHLNGAAHAQWRSALFLACAACLLWGVLTGSYFGLPPAADSALAQFAVIDASSFETMMRVSLLLGAVHIALANVARVLTCGMHAAALPPLGWIAILLAALGWMPGLAAGADLEPLREWSPYLAVAGGMLVLFFSSEEARWTHRLLDGLVAGTRVVGAFGDLLSYLRLGALGFAGSALATAFNDLALSTASLPGALSLVLAALILAVGHSINFILGVVGGVVHGLRLNFIEFFNWGLAYEGRPFNAFRRSGNPPWIS